MSAQMAMRAAQGLYEKGYITYMRTDSTTLSDTALQAARSMISERYGASYLPGRPGTMRPSRRMRRRRTRPSAPLAMPSDCRPMWRRKFPSPKRAPMS